MPDLQEPPATFLGVHRQEVHHEAWVYQFLSSYFLCDPEEGNPADIWVGFSFLRNERRPYMVSFRSQGEGATDEVETYADAMSIMHEAYAPRVLAQLESRHRVLQNVLMSAASELKQVESTLEACRGVADPEPEESPTLWERLSDPV